MAKHMYTLHDVPKYERIRAEAARHPELEPSSAAAYLLLLRVASDLLDVTEEYLAGHGLSRGRWIVLMFLYHEKGPMNPCDLAEKGGVTRATMTGLLDGLESQEYIERQTVEADRRMLDVILTLKGRKYLEGVMPGYFRLVRQLMQGLSEGEREQMIELLTKLGATALAGGKEAPRHGVLDGGPSAAGG